MALGFGIAALVMAILAIFVPIGGLGLSAIAVLLASIAGLFGDKGLAIATALIAAINTYFLSPLLYTMEAAGPTIEYRHRIILGLSIALFIIPLICVVIGAAFTRRSVDRAIRERREPKF